MLCELAAGPAAVMREFVADYGEAGRIWRLLRTGRGKEMAFRYGDYK